MFTEKKIKLMTNIVSNTHLLAKKYTAKGYIHTDNINTLKIITQKKNHLQKILRKHFRTEHFLQKSA